MKPSQLTSASPICTDMHNCKNPGFPGNLPMRAVEPVKLCWTGRGQSTAQICWYVGLARFGEAPRNKCNYIAMMSPQWSSQHGMKSLLILSTSSSQSLSILSLVWSALTSSICFMAACLQNAANSNCSHSERQISKLSDCQITVRCGTLGSWAMTSCFRSISCFARCSESSRASFELMQLEGFLTLSTLSGEASRENRPASPCHSEVVACQLQSCHDLAILLHVSFRPSIQQGQFELGTSLEDSAKHLRRFLAKSCQVLASSLALFSATWSAWQLKQLKAGIREVRQQLPMLATSYNLCDWKIWKLWYVVVELWFEWNVIGSASSL